MKRRNVLFMAVLATVTGVGPTLILAQDHDPAPADDRDFGDHGSPDPGGPAGDDNDAPGGGGAPNSGPDTSAGRNDADSDDANKVATSLQDDDSGWDAFNNGRGTN